MKISCTYFDILLYYWLPIVILTFLIFVFGVAFNSYSLIDLIYFVLPLLVSFFLLIWGISCWLINRKHFYSLSIDKKIHFNNIIVDPKSIISITPISSDKIGGLYLDLLEFVYELKNEKAITIVLAKPMLFQKFRNEPTQTLSIILTQFPELNDKLKPAIYK